MQPLRCLSFCPLVTFYTRSYTVLEGFYQSDLFVKFLLDPLQILPVHNETNKQTPLSYKLVNLTPFWSSFLFVFLLFSWFFFLPVSLSIVFIFLRMPARPYVHMYAKPVTEYHGFCFVLATFKPQDGFLPIDVATQQGHDLVVETLLQHSRPQYPPKSEVRLFFKDLLKERRKRQTLFPSGLVVFLHRYLKKTFFVWSFQRFLLLHISLVFSPFFPSLLCFLGVNLV